MPKLSVNEGEGKRIALLCRTTPDLRRQLEDAAAASGRSLSQEAEYRLQRSFDQEALVRELAKVLKDT